ncbi:hypothetical protein RUMCAL_02921 [Ruminococcus callidus ATCC 27760]|uniref:Uncharacterized protein n=1 Tax=Ruminococcus callidus ATCC 27760 TaxID=411473 RepID=U2LRK2_9FIRM|nr:hypothetical protein RUMCAL_02921 [Ruminococcus callidus ATCC 27760]
MIFWAFWILPYTYSSLCRMLKDTAGNLPKPWETDSGCLFMMTIAYHIFL